MANGWYLCRSVYLRTCFEKIWFAFWACQDRQKITEFFLGTPITVELYCDVIIEANQYLRSKPSVS